MWDFIKNFAVMVVALTVVGFFVFHATLWYIEAEDNTARTGALGSNAEQTPIFDGQVDEMGEKLDTIIEMFRALSPEQQAALRNAISNAAATTAN